MTTLPAQWVPLLQPPLLRRAFLHLEQLWRDGVISTAQFEAALDAFPDPEEDEDWEENETI